MVSRTMGLDSVAPELLEGSFPTACHKNTICSLRTA